MGQRSLAGNPNYTSNLRVTAAALTALGRIEEAQPLAQMIVDLQPDCKLGTNTLRRGAGVCWTWDMDMPDLPVIGKRCSRPGTPTR